MSDPSGITAPVAVGNDYYSDPANHVDNLDSLLGTGPKDKEKPVVDGLAAALDGATNDADDVYTEAARIAKEKSKALSTDEGESETEDEAAPAPKSFTPPKTSTETSSELAQLKEQFAQLANQNAQLVQYVLSQQQAAIETQPQPERKPAPVPVELDITEEDWTNLLDKPEGAKNFAEKIVQTVRENLFGTELKDAVMGVLQAQQSVTSRVDTWRKANQEKLGAYWSNFSEYVQLAEQAGTLTEDGLEVQLDAIRDHVLRQAESFKRAEGDGKPKDKSRANAPASFAPTSTGAPRGGSGAPQRPQTEADSIESLLGKGPGLRLNPTLSRK